MADIEVQPGVVIPEREVWFTASRSGGAGGQHVNTTSSKVSLHWYPGSSAAFSQDQRRRVLQKLRNRMTAEGELQLHCSTHRSQLRNREEACERLAELVKAALVIRKRRRKTKPTRGAVERRLKAKRVTSSRKKTRGKVGNEE
ncbi:MAG: ribosome-associated protein [Bradymonadia bacterium]|jgi:ribosome-associated protein